MQKQHPRVADTIHTIHRMSDVSSVRSDPYRSPRRTAGTTTTEMHQHSKYVLIRSAPSQHDGNRDRCSFVSTTSHENDDDDDTVDIVGADPDVDPAPAPDPDPDPAPDPAPDPDPDPDPDEFEYSIE